MLVQGNRGLPFTTVLSWSVFNESVANLDEYATALTYFISKCVEDCVSKKMMHVFPQLETKDEGEYVKD